MNEQNEQREITDEKQQREICARFHPTVSYEEMRACLAGAVIAVGEIETQEIMDFIFVDEEAPFASEEETKEYMAAYAGVWNGLVRDLQAVKPFQFSPWDSGAAVSAEILESRAARREDEIAAYIWALDRGETPCEEDFEDAPPEFFDDWIPTFLVRRLKAMEETRGAFAAKEAGAEARLHSLHSALNGEVAGRYRRYSVIMAELREKWLEEMEEAEPARPFAREAPKVGRNEPCPCGSGKKYKQCCA